MGEVLRRWPELRSDLDAGVETRADFMAFHERVATDDLPRHEGEFKRLLNTETIRELAQFNNWLRRQAEEIDARVARINEALGAIPDNPGRFIRLEKERTDNPMSRPSEPICATRPTTPCQPTTTTTPSRGSSTSRGSSSASAAGKGTPTRTRPGPAA